MTNLKVAEARPLRPAAHDDDRLAAAVRDAIAVLGPEVIEGLEIRARDGVVTLFGVADRRSTHELAVRLTARTRGVLEIVDNLTHEIDDQAPRVPAASDVLAPSAA